MTIHRHFKNKTNKLNFLLKLNFIKIKGCLLFEINIEIIINTKGI